MSPVAARRPRSATRRSPDLDLLSTRWTLRNLREYGIPMTLKQLESEVEKRRFEVIANTQRVTRTEERLKHYELMVDRCTIRAPHDGFVIYATERGRPNTQRIEPGSSVRQSQELFFLPDLATCRSRPTSTSRSPSGSRRGCGPGSRSRGWPTGPSKATSSRSRPCPSSDRTGSATRSSISSGSSSSTRSPGGSVPGMTAEVEVDVDRRLDVLAVPTEAVAVEHGRDICYVAGLDGLERRPVTLGRSNRNLMEVTGGWREGEQVVLNPSKIDAIDAMRRSTTTRAKPAESAGGTTDSASRRLVE